MAITRKHLNSNLFRQGALDRVFWQGYETIPAVYQTLFNVASSQQAEEKQLGMVGLGAMYQKHEVGSFTEAEFKSGLEQTFIHLRYGLAVRISHEAEADMKYGQIAKAIKLFGRSAIVTKETLAAAIWNNAFDNSYPWHTTANKPLCSTTHLLDDGVNTTSNRLAVDADFDATSFASMCTLMRSQVDPKNIKTRYTPKYLVGAPANEYAFQEVLTSRDRPDTAERATNVMYEKAQPVVWDYLTDADAWWLQATEHELWWYDREALATGMETIALTGGSGRGDRYYYADFRASCGIADFHGITGTPGAG